MIAVFCLRGPKVDLTVVEPLPGNPSFSEAAVLTVEDSSLANVQLDNNEEGKVYVKAFALGTTNITVTDGDTAYHYILEISKENGAVQIIFTPTD